MAYHTIEDGPWPKGTTVAAWPAANVVGGVPSGAAISSGVASANGVVELGGLTEGAMYTALGHGGSQTFEAMNQEARILALEVVQEAPINVRSSTYGAVGDGATNADGAAIKAAALVARNAIHASGVNGRGSIYIPPGIYRSLVSLTAAELEGVSIVTDGAPNTRLLRAADVPIIDFTGAGATVGGGGGSSLTGMAQKLRMQGITLDGGSNASWNTPLFRSWFATSIEADDLKLINGYGDGFDLLMVWDSIFDRSSVDSCGKGDGTTYNVHVRSALNGATAGTLGYSTDKANNIVFPNLKCETWRDGAIYVDGRDPTGTVTSTQRAQRIIFPGKLKLEASGGTFSKPPVRWEGTYGCTIEGIETVLGDLAGGATVQNYIELVSSVTPRIRGILRSVASSANNLRALVRVDGGDAADLDLIADISSVTVPTVGFLEWLNTPTHAKWSIGFPSGDRGGVYHSGTVPSGREAESSRTFVGESAAAASDVSLQHAVRGESFPRLRAKGKAGASAIAAGGGVEMSTGGSGSDPARTALYCLQGTNTVATLGILGMNCQLRLDWPGGNGHQGDVVFVSRGDQDTFSRAEMLGSGDWRIGTGTLAVDVQTGRHAADLWGVETDDGISIGKASGTGKGFLQVWEQSADPAAGATNAARLFAKDNGSGKTQLCVRFPTGATQILSTEP